ncbi:MAG TPA: transglycosylase SLT domain-containing protein [Gemmatimonadaceae bacterium]|nr:transglycosylase SLT domain-containing protein [Gemmatimonadaceae bacterium]
MSTASRAVLCAALVAIASSASPLCGAAQRIPSDRYDSYFKKYAKRYFGIGFDWKLFKAQGMAESGLSPTAKSWVGARGIMQLMPSTYHDISTHRPEMTSIDDPQWNIAAGIMHDRDMWALWKESVPDDDRWRFMFGGYNAGEGTIFRAQGVARASKLNERTWPSIESIAPTVPRWRYKETLGYVRTIEENRRRLSRLTTPRDSTP